MTLSSPDSLALDYLTQHSVLCLATTAENQPWVSPVFYALRQDALIFLSAPHTRHAKNLSMNPLASGSIQEDYKNWQDIRGIQLEGAVVPVAAGEQDDVIRCYSEKFPVTGEDAPIEISKALDKINWYKLIPSAVYFIDNSRGLGHRDRVTLMHRQ